MNVLIIGNKEDTNLLGIENIKKNYPAINFIISEGIVESNKEDLVIIMKELDDYTIKGKKSLFLRDEIEYVNNFFLISFDTIDVNINKIKLLIDIFLD